MKALRPFHALCVTILLLLMAVGVGCSRQKPSAGLRFWTPVQPEADSIVAFLDARRTNGTSFGTPADSALVKRLEAIADSVDSDVIRARALYYKSFMLTSGQSTDKESDMLRLALQLTDSAAYPYDAARIHSMLSLDYPRQIRPLINLHCADAFLAAGDSVEYAGVCNKIAFDCDANGDTVNAIRYYDEAIRMANLTGYRHLATLAAYNKLTLINTGRPAKAAAMVDSMLRDSFVMAKANYLPSLMIVAYQHDNDVNHLRHGYALFQDDRMPPVVKALYEAYLAEYHMRRGAAGRDSMEHYRQLMLSHIGDVSGAETEIWTLCAELYRGIGQEDSARIYMDKVDQFREIVYARTSSRKMESDLVHHEIARRDAAYQGAIARHKSQQRFIFISLIAIAIIGGATAWWLSRRRREARRQLDTVGRIRAMITSQSDWSDVERAFAEVAPEWTARLKKRWPSLTPGDVRMACLCYINLDTKQIARILSIAPDSAKKNRQRLRAKLAITPDRHLRDILADL